MIDVLHDARAGREMIKSFKLLVTRAPAAVTIDVLTDETVVGVGMDALVHVEIVVSTAAVIALGLILTARMIFRYSYSNIPQDTTQHTACGSNRNTASKSNQHKGQNNAKN